jgi:hypothetical protein
VKPIVGVPVQVPSSAVKVSPSRATPEAIDGTSTLTGGVARTVSV